MRAKNLQFCHQQLVTEYSVNLVATVAAGVLAIPVDSPYVAKTTGGVEALTLANGLPGQVLVVNTVAAAGAGTITPATCTGFATVALEAALDQVSLMYVDDTIGWVILSVHGGGGTTPVVA